MTTTNTSRSTIRTTFSSGAGLASNDLTAIGLGASQRAWDAPDYANLLAFDLAGLPYASVFVGAVGDALAAGVFTIGGGIVAEWTTGLESRLNPGFIGIWDESRATPPMAADSTPRMSWTWINTGTWTRTHAAASAGNTRLDLVHVAVVRSNLSATRHFKDATTGARTSQTLVIGEQLAVNIDVVVGAESSGTPTMPALPSGRHALYAALVTPTIVDKIYDFVIPVGTLKTGVEIPADSASTLGADWAASGTGIASSTAGQAVVKAPAGLRGNPSARLLGVLIGHSLKSGDSAAIVQDILHETGGSTVATTLDISGQLTMNGTPHLEFVDLRGLPATGTWSPVPIHGQGKTDRMATALNNFVGLGFTAAGSGSIVGTVTWFWVEG
jgi:hypothetical protein